MGFPVVATAQCQCTFGVAPSVFNVLPTSRVMIENKPAACIMDNIPMTNIMPFGMCNSMTNPQVAAATAAAMGVLTPMPCVPVIAAPWAPPCATVMIGGKQALSNMAKLTCNWGGVISITNPGAMKTMIP